MPPTTIREAPDLGSFTLLADHQAQTPTSFFGEKPVLHCHIKGARALTQRDQTENLPIFDSSEAATQDGGASDSQVLATVDVYVSSESLVIFNTSISTGLSIPYPSISLHATQRLPDPATPSTEVHCLYMALELSQPSSTDEDEEPPSTDLTILPPTAADASATITSLFAAVSACADLHPDAMDQDDDEEMGDSRIMFEGSVGYEGVSGLPGVSLGSADGGLPPPFPGSGGWITAENVGEFFDEEGNWIGGGEGVEVLGEGAGRVRGRDEVEEGEGEGDGQAAEVRVNGHGAGDEENKRPRVE